MSPEGIIARALNVDPSLVTDETTNKTLPEWDSLAHMTMIMEFETAYGVTLSAEDALLMTSVRAIKQKLSDYGVQW